MPGSRSERPLINTSLAAYYNAEKPNRDSSDWQLRFQVQFLLPKF